MMKYQIKCQLDIIEKAKKNFDERLQKIIGKIIIMIYHLIQCFIII